MEFNKIRNMVLYLGKHHYRHIPKTVARLEKEIDNCSQEHISPKMKTYSNILSNMLVEGGRIVFTSEKASLLEMVIGDDG